MPPRFSPDRLTLWAKGIAFIALTAFLVHRLFFAAASSPTSDPLVLSGKALGTTWEVRIAGEDLDDGLRSRAQEEIEKRLGEIDLWLSADRPDSEVSRFNASRKTDPFDVSSPTAELVAYAIELCKWSGSAFDITIGPLVARWGLNPGAPVTDPPSQEEIDAYLDRTGAEIIHVGRGNPARGGFLHKFDPAVEIDLSPIAAGYAADHIAGGLFEQDRLDFLVEVGSEVYASGHRSDGSPWRVAIVEPVASGRMVHSIVELSDQGFSTAGGPGLADLIDPRTGRPIENGMASATVIAPTATQAAAFATTLMVLGPKDGLALAEQWNLGAMTLTRAAGGSFSVERNALYPEPLDPALAAAGRTPNP